MFLSTFEPSLYTYLNHSAMPEPLLPCIDCGLIWSLEKLLNLHTSHKVPIQSTSFLILLTVLAWTSNTASLTPSFYSNACPSSIVLRSLCSWALRWWWTNTPNSSCEFAHQNWFTLHRSDEADFILRMEWLAVLLGLCTSTALRLTPSTTNCVFQGKLGRPLSCPI